MKPTTKEIVRAIRLTWASLDSHLDYTEPAKQVCTNKKCPFKDICGTHIFDKKCVKEYAEIISTLTRLL